MARIRSVHPDLFTDPAYISLSILARLFMIGIWTESDDHGAFDWQPVRLRLRILPADDVSGDALLAELVAANVVRKVEIDGRSYGLVRNFCRFQRPKKPTFKVEIPPEHRNFIALKDDGSLPGHHHITGITQEVGEDGNNTPKPLPHRSPTSRENSAQEKEEGGRRKEKEERTSNTTQSINTSVVVLAAEQEKYDDDESSNVDSVREAGNLPLPPNAIGTILPEDWTPSTSDQEVAASFGMSPTVIETELLQFHALNASRGTLSPNWSATWFRFCSAWQRRQSKQPAAAKARVELSGQFNPTPDQWHQQVAIWMQDNSRWSRQFGPEPGMGGCRCSPLILTAHGIDPKTGLRLSAPGEKPSEAKAS